MNEEGLGYVAKDLFVQFVQLQEEYQKKIRDEGKMTKDDWYLDIYNKNVENRQAIRDDLGKYYENRNKDIDAVRTVLKRTEELKVEVAEQTKAIKFIGITGKPTVVYIFGKHISGWYFFPFMALLFIFLWFFASGYFEMKEEAKFANVKLQVIRDDFGHYPTIKHVFEMLDSTCTNPIPPKIEKNDNDD